LEFELDRGAPAHLTIDVRELGAIHVDVFRPDGLEYREHISLIVAEGEAGVDTDGNPSFVTRGSVLFREAPYVLPCLSPGRYRVLLLKPSFDGATSVQLEQADVLPGAMTPVVFALSR
jgi:hypothetical protein